MWNAEQQAFIDAPFTDGALIGCPGAGKSSICLARVVRLVDDGLIPPVNGFMVLTFSRAACADFKERGHQMRPGLFNDDNVRTIHSLSYFIAGESSMETVVSRAVTMLKSSKRGDIRESVPCLANVEAIFIDEAQDISAVQYDLACCLRDALNAPLVLVGDPNQNIYQFQAGSDRYLKEHPGFRVHLVHNYRSTAAIVALANAARPVKGPDMISSSGVQGDKPVLVTKRAHEIAERIVDISKEALSRGLSVAVIGPVKKAFASYGGVQTNIGLQWAFHHLRKEDVPVRVHYREDSQIDEQARKCDMTIGPGTVHLMTMHGSKGLEFDVVMVLNFHRRLMGRDPSARDVNDHPYLMFVGLSRAKQYMYVFKLLTHHVWQGYHAYADHMDLEGEPVEEATVQVPVDRRALSIGWTDLLKNRVIMDESSLADLEDAMGIRVTHFGEHFVCKQLRDIDQLSALYGLWAENTFFHRYRGESPPCLRQIESMMGNLVSVPVKFANALRALKHKLGMDNAELLQIHVVEDNKEDIPKDFYDFLVERLDTVDARGAFFFVPDICRWYDEKELKDILAKARSAVDARRPISRDVMWRMCLFLWQYRVEAKHRWYRQYGKHLRELEDHERYITQTAAALEDDWRFCIDCDFGQVPVTGIADAVHKSRREIIELKFCSVFQKSHAVQAVGYALMLGGDWSVKVLNLKTRVETTVDAEAIADPSRAVAIVTDVVFRSDQLKARQPHTM